MGKAALRDNRIKVIVERLQAVDKYLEADEAAFAAQTAHEVSKLAINLSDELRFEQGVRAGLNRAADGRRKK